MYIKEKRKAGIIIIVAAVLCACASAPSTRESSAQNQTPSLLIETPERPRWINHTPENGEFLYFTGMAESESESEARNAAAKNSFAAAAGFYANFIQSETVDHSIFIEDMGRTIADATTYDDKTNTYTNAVISELTTVEYYQETVRTQNNRITYKAWVLCRVPRQKAEQDIADFAKNTSRRYGSLLSVPSTLHAALVMHGEILAALEQNPLHRAVAYYDGPGGRVNLYEYLILQMNTLAGSVSFAPMPSAAVEKTAALDTTVTLVSSRIAPVGALDCAVSIYGMNNSAPRVKYTVRADNSFSLKIFTSRLTPGRYTVQLELLLNEINPRIRKNPTESFSLEVRPLSASMDLVVSGGSIGEAEKTALVQGIQEGIQNYGVPVNLKTDQAEQSGAVFTVTLHFRIQEPAPLRPTALVVCEAAIDFSRNGQTQESSSKRITEFDTAGAVMQARKFIRENESFFQNVERKLSQ
jgi:hypothetical protein